METSKIIDKYLKANAKGKFQKDVTIQGKKLSLSQLREGKRGLLYEGVIYPFAKLESSQSKTWKLMGSSKTHKHKAQFKDLKKILKDANPKERKNAYLGFLNLMSIPDDVSLFIYDYVNHPNIKTPLLKQFSNVNPDSIVNLFQNEKAKNKGTFEEDVADEVNKKKQIDKQYVKTDKGEKVASYVASDGTVVNKKVGKDYEERAKFSARDPTKYVRKLGGKEFLDGKEIIKGRVLRTELLRNGRFGYVFRGRLFPMFQKAEFMEGKTSSWGLVNENMSEDEKELFRKMYELDDEGAMDLYFRYYEDEKGIPLDVLFTAMNVANNEGTDLLMAKIQNEMSNKNMDIERGFNINPKRMGKNDAFESIDKEVKKISRMDYVPNEAEMKSMEKLTKKQVSWVDVDSKIFQQEHKKRMLEKYGVLKSEIDNIELSDSMGVVDERLKLRRLDGDVRNDPDDEGEVPISRPEDEPEQPIPDITNEVYEAQQTDNKEKQKDDPFNVKMNIEERKKGEQIRYGGNTGDSGKSKDPEAQKKDTILDMSKYGHQKAVGNVFLSKGKDFTYYMNVVKNNPSMSPSKDDNIRKQQIMECVMIYGEILPILEVKDYSYGNALEILTLKYGFIENAQFERKWKFSLIDMTESMGGGGGDDGDRNMGVIINTEHLGITATDLFNNVGNKATEPEELTPFNNKKPNNYKPLFIKEKKNKKNKKEPRVRDERIENQIHKPQDIQPSNTKRTRVREQKVVLNIRNKLIQPNLLFTNLNNYVAENIPEEEGDLPIFNYRNVNKNRIKL